MQPFRPLLSAESLDAVPRLGKYHLIALLAHGGMGDVYLAVFHGPEGFSKLLVVKELRQEVLNNNTHVTMFLDEARIAARLNHPNVVQTIEVGESEGHRFIAMEYLEGQPLNRMLLRARQRGIPIPLAVQLRIIVDVLSALEYAHSVAEYDGTPLGVVHRDVSPQNIFVAYDGHVKLIDFGIAKTGLGTHQTHSGVLKGKIRYMAPEQTTSQLIDRRADIFGVGIVLWEAVAGRGPWESAQDVAILRSLMSGSVPRLRVVRRDIDRDLAAIVDRATAPEASARYPTAIAMREDIERYLVAHEGSLRTSRDLPALMTTLFADDRRDLRAIVESRLRTMRTSAALEDRGKSGIRSRSGSESDRRRVDDGSSPAMHSLAPTSIATAKKDSTKKTSVPAAVAAIALSAAVAVALPWASLRLQRRPLPTPAASNESSGVVSPALGGAVLPSAGSSTHGEAMSPTVSPESARPAVAVEEPAPSAGVVPSPTAGSSPMALAAQIATAPSVASTAGPSPTPSALAPRTAPALAPRGAAQTTPIRVAPAVQAVRPLGGDAAHPTPYHGGIVMNRTSAGALPTPPVRPEPSSRPEPEESPAERAIEHAVDKSNPYLR